MAVELGQKLTVEIWSDLICPWCFIGLRKFQLAMEAFPHRDSVEVIHRAFRLAPGASVEPVIEVIPRKYGLAPSKAGAMFQRVEEAGRAVGLDMNLEVTLHGDTVDGHRLVQFAATKGRQHELVARLHRAYFTEGSSIFDRGNLVDFATEAGLDRREATEVLEGDEFRENVEADQRWLQDQGVNGVPFFLIGGRYGISGAQEPEVFGEALQEAWQVLGGPSSQE